MRGEAIGLLQTLNSGDAAMTARFGNDESPNACLSCHRDKDAQWLQARMVERGAAQ